MTAHMLQPNWEAWLRDRRLHRAPVDAHFAQALTWIAANPPAAWADVLELGPGPEMDLTEALRAVGRKVWTADTKSSSMRTGEYDIILEQADVLPFGEASFGAVLAREVFEHVYPLAGLLGEIHRVLMPSGRLWLSTVFCFPLHDYETGDYWRVSDAGWYLLLRDAGFRDYKAWGERLLFDSWQFPVSILGWAQK